MRVCQHSWVKTNRRHIMERGRKGRTVLLFYFFNKSFIKFNTVEVFVIFRKNKFTPTVCGDVLVCISALALVLLFRNHALQPLFPLIKVRFFSLSEPPRGSLLAFHCCEAQCQGPSSRVSSKEFKGTVTLCNLKSELRWGIQGTGSRKCWEALY